VRCVQVRELNIAEHAEPMEVKGKGKEKLVAANDSFGTNDTNDDLEKFEGTILRQQRGVKP